MPKNKASISKVPPYGVAIHQAIAAGDLRNMKAVAKQASQHLVEHGDVGAALEALKIEIAKLEAPEALTICSEPFNGRCITPRKTPSKEISMPKDKASISQQRPYGVAVQQAIASGDLPKMKAAAKQATQYLAEHGDVSAALEALRIEIARLEGRKP